jgi:protein-disulfide isomerase
MFKRFISIFILTTLLIGSSALLAKDNIQVPSVIKSSIIKQYGQAKIKILSIKKIKSKKYQVIVKTDTGKDKVIITKKGKILSISDYLVGMEPSGGC